MELVTRDCGIVWSLLSDLELCFESMILLWVKIFGVTVVATYGFLNMFRSREPCDP